MLRLLHCSHRRSFCSEFKRFRCPTHSLLVFPFSSTANSIHGAATDNTEQTRPEPPPIRVAFTESAGRGVFATRKIGAGELIHTAKPSIHGAATDNTEQTRPEPPPIRVAFTESAGRGVFATRKIGAGELIHTAKPIVSHPSLCEIGNVCFLCLRRLKRGNDYPSAQFAPFCSAECREDSKGFYGVERNINWSTYHEYCRAQGLKYPLMVKRLACMIVSGVASVNCVDILQPAQLHAEGILRLEEEYGLLRSAFEAAADFCREDIQFLTKDWYIHVLARIRINAFRIELIGGSYEDLLSLAAASVKAEAASGNAVYILPSFYNHDCDPNTHIIWMENVNARLKTLRDIEEGEELRICYIDASMDRDARQRILAEGFGFRCSCPRCVSGD